MTPSFFDHALAALLVVGVPLWGAHAYRKLLRALARGETTRVREYWWTVLSEWGLVALVLFTWFWHHRVPADLGLLLPADIRSVWGAGLTLLAIAVLYWQWRSVHVQDDEQMASLRSQMEAVSGVLPHTANERRVFRLLALTAGITEEILYRGYLIWYFAALIGFWPGVTAAVLAFAAGHAYQGGAGIIKTGAVGLLYTLLYVFTGSLVWPMIVHAAMDLHGGALAYRVLSSDGSGGS